VAEWLDLFGAPKWLPAKSGLAGLAWLDGKSGLAGRHEILLRELIKGSAGIEAHLTVWHTLAAC
jgi:hypothetical protein